MQNSNETSATKRPIIIFGLILAALFISTNPDSASFEKYCLQQVQVQSNPLRAIWSHINVMLTKVTGNSDLQNFYLFSIVKLNHSKLEAIFGHLKDSNCFFLGFLNNWIPICTIYEWPDCTSLNSCSSKGVCVSTAQCICLPSWTGEDCSKKIPGFTPIFKSAPAFTWLEAIIFTQILIYAFITLLPFTQEFLRVNLVCTWRKFALEYRFWNIFTNCLFHESFFQLLVNIYGFYTYSPILYQQMGRHSFEKFFFGCAGLISLFALAIGNVRQKNRPIYGASGILIAVKTLFVMINYNWTDSILRSLLQVVFSQLVLDYMLSADNLNPVIHICGLLTGYCYYKYVYLGF